MDIAEGTYAMKVFISYSSKDRESAKALASQLREAGLDVYDPFEDVVPGDNLPLKIGKALRDSDAMIVLLSPDAVKSQWVRREIDYALSSRKFQHRVIPVVLRPTRDIPWILRRLPLVRLYEDPDEGKRQVISKARDLAKAGA